MKAKFKVNLSKPLSGYAIANAVRKTAGDMYHEELAFVDDDGSSYEIGQNSEYPYEDIVIGVGPNAIPEVSMVAVYGEVYVLSWEHKGMKFAIGYSNDNIINAVRSFRDRLQLALDSK